jgi:two-component system, LuxR family, response regulator FixJ
VTVESTVFVVGDDHALRESLAWLLESVRLPARTFASAQEFLRAFDKNQPGCLVLDVRMPGMSGLELLDRLTAEEAGLPVILLTAHADVPMAVRALKTGAVDFFTKPFNSQELLDHIQVALEKDRQRRAERARIAALAESFAALTPREREVMTLVVGGLSNKQIAGDLGISAKTVEAHRNKVMEKTKAGSVAELVRMAIACGAALPLTAFSHDGRKPTSPPGPD